MCSSNKIIPISSIYFKNDGYVPISDHPYYLSIHNNDPRIIEDYVKTTSSRQKKKKTSTFQGLLDLQNQIKIEYDYTSDPIMIKKKSKAKGPVCNHGRHRMCILYNLYPNATIEVNKKGHVIKIWLEGSNFSCLQNIKIV